MGRCWLGRILCVCMFSLTCWWWQASAEDDAQCLKQFKDSVQDPRGFLSNWDFGNASTRGYVCSFNGVSCWNGQENKVIGLKLQGVGLVGSFPSGLVLCRALQILDLSRNSLSGAIPNDVCTQLPYITYMDLSENRFSGPIPFNFENCLFLHSLLLQHNQLSGQLPGGIGILPRLTSLDVSSNLLSGSIPSSYTNRTSVTGNAGPPFPVSSFEDNPKLCGPPLSFFCPSKSNNPWIAASVVGCTGLLVLLCGCIVLWVLRRVRKRDNMLLRDDHFWAKRIKAPKSVPVSLFEKPVKELKLSDLLAATNCFDQGNILYESSRGTVYKAILFDGSMLEVQRLRRLRRMEQDFQSEMDTLGCMRHKNLVPLLGYCTAGSEKLLVYKHMKKRSLRENLHDVPEESKLDWITRLKIGIGAARGLAWLHHSCNPRIIHRNISSDSIRIDQDFEAKISDFGLARLLNLIDAHINTDVKWPFGDMGYIPPEYPHTLLATVKGDVYSFGIVLLELVTGQRANDVCAKGDFKGNLADWVMFVSSNGGPEEVLDPSIRGEGFEDELIQFLNVGCACVMPEPKDRPTMYEVYYMLRSIGHKLKITNDELAVYSDVGNTEEADELLAGQDSEKQSELLVCLSSM